MNPSLGVAVSPFTAIGPSSVCPIPTPKNLVDAVSFDPASGGFFAVGRPEA